MSQLPLPLAYRSADGEADFFVSQANAAAVEWLDRWPDWPVPCALLIGPPGSGKSHLARIFARRTGATVADDAEALDAETLFHRWNAATREAPLLMTATRPPRDWPHGLADLGSRLAATPQLRIEAPDDALLAALLLAALLIACCCAEPTTDEPRMLTKDELLAEMKRRQAAEVGYEFGAVPTG